MGIPQTTKSLGKCQITKELDGLYDADDNKMTKSEPPMHTR